MLEFSPTTQARLDFKHEERIDNVNYNRNGDHQRSALVPKLEGKTELFRSPEATYALWGNNATKHDYNKYFNKYEATKQRVSSMPFPREVDNQYQYSEKEGAVDNGWHGRNQYVAN